MMYGVYQQLKSMVWGEGSEREKTEPQSAPSPAPKPQKRFFSGEITSLSDTSGMIDHQVFFTPSVVMGGRTPQVGALVHVTAERPHPLACWQATRVEVTESWDSDTDEERRTLIGSISKISRTLAVVDCSTSEVTFDPQLYCGTGYRYETGDWVTVGVRLGEEEEEDGEVEFVRPLREKEVEGVITSMSRGYGFVDDDIIFSLGLCGRSQVRIGEEVKVKCVEFRHHQASWRAVSMTTLSFCPHTLPSSQHSPSLPLVSPSSLSSYSSSSCDGGLLKNRCGLELSEVGEIGDVLVGTQRTVTIAIRNTRSHDHCLLSVKPLPHDPQISVSLPPSLWCSCHHLHRGGSENGATSDTGEAGEMCDSSEEAVKKSRCQQSQGEEEGVSEVGVVSTPHVHIASGRSLDVTVAIRAK
jgi:hypothetical protein